MTWPPPAAAGGGHCHGTHALPRLAAGLNPTIANLAVAAASSHTCVFDGTIVAGAIPGLYLAGSYRVTGSARASGGTAESILGTEPFAIWEDVG